jgi:hypothetical protein
LRVELVEQNQVLALLPEVSTNGKLYELGSNTVDEAGSGMLIDIDGVRSNLSRHARVAAVGFGL